MPEGSEKSDTEPFLSESPFQRSTEQNAELGIALPEDGDDNEYCWPSLPVVWQVWQFLFEPSNVPKMAL